MQQFTAGLILGAAAVLTAWFFFKRKARQVHDRDTDKQLSQLSRLIGQIAHEIKNPLSTIMVNLKLISEQLNSTPIEDDTLAGASRKIAVVKKEAARVEQILDDFLRYVGKTELSLQVIDINLLMSDIIDFYMPQAQSRKITIRQSLAMKPVVCKVDPDMLKQVMLNLFINAQQAMPQGGDLMIRTEKRNEFGVILVSDTGIGIEPEKLKNIFRAYYSSKEQGSGLGLATVKKIIEMHGGSIQVNSEPGKGTLFTIELPMAK